MQGNPRPVQKPLSKPQSQEIPKPEKFIVGLKKNPQVIPNNQSKLGQKRNNLPPNNVYTQRINNLLNSASGRILIMVACGPSVNEVDFSPLFDKDKIDFMIINKPLDKIPKHKYWCFCDDSQYKRNIEYYNSYNGSIMTSVGVKAGKSNHIKINAFKGVGWSNNLAEGMYIGRSSTYSFMQMATWMNYDKVFIFGCDMSAVNGQLHHYGVNPDVQPDIRASRFQFEAKSYAHAGEKLSKEVRNKFYFCSSYNKFGFIEKFNRLDHLKAVEYILSILQ